MLAFLPLDFSIFQLGKFGNTTQGSAWPLQEGNKLDHSSNPAESPKTKQTILKRFLLVHSTE